MHKGYQVLRFLILATIAQWVVLFYLTYTGYGWDFCEPIGNYSLSIPSLSHWSCHRDGRPPILHQVEKHSRTVQHILPLLQKVEGTTHQREGD